jgi:glutathione S-transferase
MALQLLSHPLSSYCHKVLIALYELNLAFEAKMVNPGDQAEREAFLALWPTGKIPLLVDDGQVVPETSIMIEYLQQRHAPAAHLLPADPALCLEARLCDRLFDNYVMTPVQSIVGQQLRDPAARDAQATASARTTLAMAYGMIEQRLGDGREWAAGRHFSIADCAAAPSLFYATTLVPLEDKQQHLRAYFERLVTRASVRRVLEEAKPWFKYYPFKELIPSRFTA